MQEENLSEEQIQEIILEILSGERLVRQELGNGHWKLVKFIYPTASQRQHCNLLEEIALEKAEKDGLPLEKDVDEVMQDAFFSLEDMESLSELRTKAEGFEKLLKKRIKGTEVYNKDLEKLENLRSHITHLEKKRSQVSEFTAEYQAREDKYFELLSFSASSVLENKLLWNSSKELLDSCDVGFAYTLLNKFLNFYWGYNSKTIRKIARSPQWRTMYLSSEKGARLTDKSAKDLPVAYLHLMSWSMYYQSISEMLSSDRPSEEVIEDDERLDKYMQEYQARVKKEAQALKRKTEKTRGAAFDQDQVVVTAESKNYINLHKEDGYSDTSIISGRVSEKGKDSSYSEVKEHRLKKREKMANRSKRSKAKFGGLR